MNVYEEGLAMLRQGDLQGGLAKVQTAASAVALPECVDKASEIKDDLLPSTRSPMPST